MNAVPLNMKTWMFVSLSPPLSHLLTNMLKLSEIKLGETVTIVSFIEEDISENLMKMGFIPGEKITVERFAPLGDPIIVEVFGYRLSMRKAEAERVLVEY